MFLYSSWNTHVLIPSGSIPRNGTAGPQDVCVFRCGRSCQPDSRSSWTVYLPPTIYEISVFSTFSPALAVVSLFAPGHLDACDVGSHCGCDLAFPCWRVRLSSFSCAHWTSVWAVCLGTPAQAFCPFLEADCLSFLIASRSSLYILHTSPLSNRQISSPRVVAFSLFCWTKFFISVKYNLSVSDD